MKKVNYWAVIVTVLATFIASAIWYAVMSTQYFELRGINPHDQAATAMSAGQVVIIFLRHITVVLVMAYLFGRFGVRGLKAGLGMGLLLFIGFPLVLLAGSVSSDHVPIALASIHGADWLFKLLIIGAILATWQKKQK